MNDTITESWSEVDITVEYETTMGLKEKQATFNRELLLKERKEAALRQYLEACVAAPNREERRKLERKAEEVDKTIDEMTLEDFEQRIMTLAQEAANSPIIETLGKTIRIIPVHRITQVIVEPLAMVPVPSLEE